MLYWNIVTEETWYFVLPFALFCLLFLVLRSLGIYWVLVGSIWKLIAHCHILIFLMCRLVFRFFITIYNTLIVFQPISSQVVHFQVSIVSLLLLSVLHLLWILNLFCTWTVIRAAVTLHIWILWLFSNSLFYWRRSGCRSWRFNVFVFFAICFHETNCWCLIVYIGASNLFIFVIQCIHTFHLNYWLGILPRAWLFDCILKFGACLMMFFINLFNLLSMFWRGNMYWSWCDFMR